MKKRKWIILVSIFILAFALRIYKINSIPPHPSLDEGSIGYNAYSFLQTGKDEFGYKLPVLLRAYDDYRPAHYTYLVVPFVKLFGLTVFSVRLSSVLLSIATIVAVYYLVKGLCSKYKNKEILAVITIGLLSISPWHIYISRLGHEVNLFFSTFIFGATFFYLYLEKKRRYFLLLSSISFAFSFSAYQSGKVFVPLVLIVFITIYYKELLKEKFFALLNILIFFVIVSPILLTLTHPQALVRFHSTNIYSLADPYLKISAQKIMQAKESNDIFTQIINNRRLVYVLLPATAYISHLNPIWLFTNGGDEQFKIPNLGLLFLFEFPLILIGIYHIFIVKQIEKSSKIVIFIWVLISILPAAITTGFPHAMRIYQILPLPQFLAALGVLFLFERIKRRRIVIVAASLIIIWGVVTLFNSYFIEFPKKTAHQFQYGVTQALQFAAENENKYEQIYVSNKQNLFQSYMFYLFFTRYDPTLYQKDGGTISGGFAEEHSIGKYHFGNISNITQKRSLIISNPEETTDGKIVKKIYYPDGKEAIWISEVP